MKIAVISDIHANGRALRAALTAAQSEGFDQLLLLGDLLTYGVDVQEVLDLVSDAVARQGAVLLAGNHDQLYFDLASGITTYLDGLPAWLRETAQWTHEQLSEIDLQKAFPWAKEWRYERLYAAHANPFAYGDWTYLTKPSELVRAGQALRNLTATVGVFGHSHRVGVHSVGLESVEDLGSCGTIELCSHRTHVVNPGSTGQPRDKLVRTTMAIIALEPARSEIMVRDLDYDVAAHVASLASAGLSASTNEKLASFFRPS